MREKRPNRSECWIPSNMSPFSTTVDRFEPVKSRPDINTAFIVEGGVMLFHTKGIRQATEFLKQHKVPLDVAVRVLLHPSQRRKTKPVFEEQTGMIPYWTSDIGR